MLLHGCLGGNNNTQLIAYQKRLEWVQRRQQRCLVRCISASMLAAPQVAHTTGTAPATTARTPPTILRPFECKFRSRFQSPQQGSYCWVMARSCCVRERDHPLS